MYDTILNGMKQVNQFLMHYVLFPIMVIAFSSWIIKGVLWIRNGLYSGIKINELDQLKKPKLI